MSRMRPVHGASPLLTLALLLSTPALAHAEPAPAPSSLAALIADVAEANQRLSELGAAVQTEQETVNKAILDVQTARDDVVAAQHDLDRSQQGVRDAEAAIAAAQRKFDDVAVASYMNGPSASYLTAADPTEIIASAATEHTLALSTQKVFADLQQARTEQLNSESQARAAKAKADAAAGTAQASQDNAVAALAAAQQNFRDQQNQITELGAQRDAAEAQLAQARAAATPPSADAAVIRPQAAAARPAGPVAGDWDHAPTAAVPYGSASQWDTTLPMVPSAFVSGDPIAIINEILKIGSTSAQVTADLGKGFLQKLGILKPADTGITNGGVIPRVYGRQASEYVIQRAMRQMGVPYSWGGGNAAGPSRGIDQGAGTVGFDCSGLILHAFAGVGIKLPHYSGSQYNMGRKIPSSQMRRGDAIFYGPGGSQHVALYLGNGQMLEAPYTGSVVKVSPVRTSGMTPHVVRYIEY
ncbi:peptidoglycan endopeptidase RipA [Mycolicibacterium murale]|uniref:Peptidoglycan endopeptidase RipA n=2 Tax=Mycolicibacterium murale TaxID=182220 RepID=A0A7I9WRK5_9MYCO|nr:NlpC/P60 family peptidoglycan endopeptidase RipA [Mycolicibacterium murale]MCV7183272.1 NlpC/P60 family peptidoglycan endopeptidase RipA [Mycolicibacterium murale]GFG60000.1 peptidoglycan endopeptidase RipA [Mycolicibacterium murale]